MKTTLNCGRQILVAVISPGNITVATPKRYDQVSLQKFFADINKNYPQFSLNLLAIHRLNMAGKVILPAGEQTLTLEYIQPDGQA